MYSYPLLKDLIRKQIVTWLETVTQIWAHAIHMSLKIWNQFMFVFNPYSIST